MNELVQKTIDSPVGAIRLVASGHALVGVYFAEHRGLPTIAAREVERHDVLDRAAGELGEYFAGERQAFTTPLGFQGTGFQRDVWTALTGIPFGETTSYADLARRIGNPKAVRAVGAANGRNPLSIFVPCHRVIATGGELTGYAGGLPAKRWLLDHERKAKAA